MRGLLTRRIRVVDGLIVAAVALLILKGSAYLLAPSEPELGPDGLPRFGAALSHARQNYVPPDPTTTGSVPDKPKDPPAPPPAPASPPAQAGKPDPATPAATPDAGSTSQRAIRERLGERREELQQRGRELESRERLIEEVERRLDARAEDMRRSEERQAGAAAATASAEAATLKPLVTMYETMKPKEAARVFERLPQDVLVPVVRLINPRKMAEILAAMSPDSAEKLTVALARRPRGGADDRGGTAALPAGELPAIEPPPRPASAR